MKNDKWQFVVGTSDFYLSLVICHLTENPCEVAKDFRVSSTDLCSSVFICGSVLCSSSKSLRGPRREHRLQPFGIGGDPAAAPAHNLVLYAEDHRGAAQVQSGRSILGRVGIP